MNVNDVVDQLALAATHHELHVYGQVPPAPEFPAMVFGMPTAIEYHQSLKGRCTLTFDVLFLIARIDDVEAQRKLGEFLSVPGLLVDIERWRPAESSAYRDAVFTDAGEFDTFAIGETRLLSGHLALTVKT